MEKTLDRNNLESMLLVDLQGVAKEIGLTGITGLRKQELIENILNRKVEDEGLFIRTGILDILPEGYGFLRARGYLPSEDDIYVSLSQIRRFHLKRGDEVMGQVRPPKDSEKYNALLRIEKVNDDNPEVCSRSKSCATRDVWGELKKAVSGVLESITLQDLVERQKSKEQSDQAMYYV